jgi:hypothetical protein
MFDLAEELESELYEEIDKQQRLYDQIVKPLQLRSESEIDRILTLSIYVPDDDIQKKAMKCYYVVRWLIKGLLIEFGVLESKYF